MRQMRVRRWNNSGMELLVCAVYIMPFRWARFAHPPAACDSDIFHYITTYIHNMHAIEELIIYRVV